MEDEKKTRGFAIYFLARSGSTYIIHRLRNHPSVVARAEVFGASSLPNDIPQTSDNQIAFLRRFWKPYRKDSFSNDCISRGFKVQISKQNPQLVSLGRYVKVAQEYDVCHFFLYRKNQVKQLVSSYQAIQIQNLTLQQTGQSVGHIYRDKANLNKLEFTKINIDPLEFKFKLNSLEKNLNLLENIKGKLGSTKDFYYENIMKDKVGFFEEFFRLIGVDYIELEEKEEVLKATSDNLRDILANFDEIHSVLKGTKFEAQLLEGAD